MDRTFVRQHFNRIEVSNICNKHYFGVKTTFETFGPLLRNLSFNLYVILVMFFLNAVMEAKMMIEHISPVLAEVALMCEIRLAGNYIMHGLRELSSNPA